MAWWVVWGHMAQFAGYSGQQAGLPAFMYVLLRGSVPVDVFVTLSGFVIFMLLDRARNESYPIYLVGRFFRLYPTYLVCLVLALLATPLLHVVLTAPWGDAHHVSESIKRLAHQENSLMQHVVLHLSLLHGLVPDQWLPHAGDSILGPAWSLSLEWQFYLVAPLFFYAAARRQVWWMLLCLVLLLVKLLALNSGLTFNWGGFLPLKFEFFMLGMGSFFVWRRVTSTGELGRPIGTLFGALAGAYVVMFFVGGMREHFFAIAVWLTAFFGALWRVHTIRENPVSKILGGAVLLYIGRMSYVTYIVHIVIVQLIGYLMVRYLDPETSRQMVFLVMAIMGSALVLVASVIIHKYVEKPGIELGKMLRQRGLSRVKPAG